MSTLFELLEPNTQQREWRQYIFPVCIGTTLLFVTLELITMIVIASRMSIALNDLTPMTIEVQTTLHDVQVVLPEMRSTVHMLGQLVPEITEGMKILQQLCQHDPHCTI